MARVIAICNAKGGVGKTTTAVNLGAYLSLAGRKTLLVDFDPQANASSALGVNPREATRSVYHGLFNLATPRELIRPASIRGFHCIPAAPHLAGAIVELVPEADRESYLRRFLHSVRHYYDYILIDLPPSLSLLTVNGLVAADEVLIPVQAEYYSLEGIGQLLETVGLIRSNLGHPLKVAGALLTMYDKNEPLNRDVARNLRENFPHHVFDIEIPRHAALAEAPSFSLPIVLYRPYSPGAGAYHRLAAELVAQEQKLLLPAHPEYTSPNFGNFNV